MVKLAIDSLFEYTEDEKNIICIDIIKSYTKNKFFIGKNTKEFKLIQLNGSFFNKSGSR